jgi:hypothetical protein
MGPVKLVQDDCRSIAVELIKLHHVDDIALDGIFRGLDFPLCIDQKQIRIRDGLCCYESVDIFEREKAAKIILVIARNEKRFRLEVFLKENGRRTPNERQQR